MKAIQIIDANFNRVREGIRVVEDGIRFYFENEELFKKVKDFRHKFINEVLKNFELEILRKGRDIFRDTGRKYDILKKENIDRLIEKNCLRIEEGLRVIEEYSKCLKSSLSKSFHNLRFEFYEIEKQIITYLSKKKIPVPSVYVIINLKDNQDIMSFAESIIDGKPDIIQLRYKGENTKFFARIAKKLKKIIPDEIIFIINDRVDICLISEADGVHLGEKDISVEDARKLLPDKIIGVSTNSLKEAERYLNKNIDYLAIGAIYPSPTKKNRKTTGPEIIKEIKKKYTIPVVAIGGINRENVCEVIKNGADCVAFISAIEKAENPQEYLKQIKRKVKKEWMKKRKKRKNNQKNPR